MHQDDTAVPHLLPLKKPPLYFVQELNPEKHFTQSLTHCTALRRVGSSPTSLACILSVTLGRKDCCHGLPFSLPLHFHMVVDIVVGNKEAGVMRQGNRQLEEKSNMSSFRFGSKQRHFSLFQRKEEDSVLFSVCEFSIGSYKLTRLGC